MLAAMDACRHTDNITTNYTGWQFGDISSVDDNLLALEKKYCTLPGREGQRRDRKGGREND